MLPNCRSPLPVSNKDRGTSIALIYALVGERLTVYYEHGKWITDTQGASLVAEWLARSTRKMSSAERRHLSANSYQIAKSIAESVSREAGLHIAHEIQESLDPNYHSDLGRALMIECERVFEEIPKDK